MIEASQLDGVLYTGYDIAKTVGKSMWKCWWVSRMWVKWLVSVEMSVDVMSENHVTFTPCCHCRAWPAPPNYHRHQCQPWPWYKKEPFCWLVVGYTQFPFFLTPGRLIMWPSGLPLRCTVWVPPAPHTHLYALWTTSKLKENNNSNTLT